MQSLVKSTEPPVKITVVGTIAHVYGSKMMPPPRSEIITHCIIQLKLAFFLSAFQTSAHSHSLAHILGFHQMFRSAFCVENLMNLIKEMGRFRRERGKKKGFKDFPQT